MKHTSKISAFKLLKTGLSLILVLSMLFAFVGCAKTETAGNDDPAQTPDTPAEDVVDIRNDPKEYEGLEKDALLRKLTKNHLLYYMESAVDAPVNPFTGGKVDLTLTMGDTIMDMLQESAGEEVDLSFLEKISLSMNVGVSDNMYKMAIGAGLNGKTVVTANMLMDLAENVMYMAVPELNDAWIALPMDEMMDSSSASMEEATAMLEQFAQALPSGETVSNLLSRYVDIALAQLTNVEQTTESLTVGDITQECTALTLKIYEADALNMVKAVLTEAKDDAELKKIIEDVAAAMEEMAGEDIGADQAYTDFVEAIDDMLASMNEMEATSEEYIQMVVYIDSAYNIAGMDLSQENFRQQPLVLNFYNLTDGDKFAFEANFPDMIFGADESKIVGSGTVSGGKTTGTYTWVLEEYEFLVIEVKDLDDNSGSVTVRPTEDLLDELGVALPFVELGLQIKLSGDTMELNLLSASTLLVGISVKAADSNGPAISVPSDAVDGMDSSAMQAWAESLDLQKLLDNLEAAGVPSELIDALSGAYSGQAQESTQSNRGDILVDTWESSEY